MEDTLNNQNLNNQPQNPTSDDNPVKPTTYKENGEQPEDLDSRWTRWKCLQCGYLYEGVKELKKCPKCGNENPDQFKDAD